MASRARFRIWLARGLALSLAAALVIIAGPYAWASYILLPTRPVLETLDSRTPMEILNETAQRQAEASQYFMTGNDIAAQGSVGFLLRDKALLVESLRHHPADAKNWARLASLRLAIEDRTTALAFYKHSLELGYYLPGFTSWRLMLGISLWPHMDDSLKKLTAEQAYLLWHRPAHRKEFLRLARIGTIGPALKDMLQTYHPEEMAEFMRRWQPPQFMKPPR